MRFGIAVRMGLMLTLVGILAAGATGYYAYDLSRAMLMQSAKDELLTSTKVLARRIALTREEASRNLHILARHPAALAALQMPDAGQEEQLATLFKLVMDANPRYFQIRLISASGHGMERVRIDRDGSALIRVSGDDLQEKGHFSYVFDALKLPAGSTYMSRIAINHERGVHAGLEQPTVQLAMPVTDGRGATLGVIVINADLNGMFALLAADLPGDYRLYLVNRDGDYLIHPDPTQTFGFDKGRRVLVQDEFAATGALIEGKTDSVLVVADDGRHAKAPILAAFIKQRVKVASDESHLILGLAQPLAAMQAQTAQLGKTTLRIVLALCLVCVVLAALMARVVARPINSMSAAVQRFADEHPAGELPVTRRDEIGVLARAFAHMQAQISRQLAELRQSREELEHLARHDTLTGLPNRALFADRMAQALAVARREQTRLALMFIDLDHFKPINDNLGHAVGDLVLKEIAERIRAVIRESDTAARIGGDEFVILLPQVQHDQDAVAVAEKVRQAINAPLHVDGHALGISASIGIALYPENGASLIELSKHADRAMYHVKEQGRDAVAIYQTDTGPA